MASFAIHLAIAKIYLNNNKIEYPKEFLKGVVEPDLVQNKKTSHCSETIKEPTLKEYLKAKVNLTKFVEGNQISSDYQKGVFLHLITDYEMYNNYFEKEYIENINYEDFCNDLYHSYDQVNDQVTNSYRIDIDPVIKKQIENRISKKKKRLQFDTEKNCQFQNVFPIEKLDPWIQKIGNTNLEEYKQKIERKN